MPPPVREPTVRVQAQGPNTTISVTMPTADWTSDVVRLSSIWGYQAEIDGLPNPQTADQFIAERLFQLRFFDVADLQEDREVEDTARTDFRATKARRTVVTSP